jgi:hypothetical protein
LSAANFGDLNQEARNRGNGIAELEGKAATVAATELGQRRSFKTGEDQEFLEIHGFQI